MVKGVSMRAHMYSFGKICNNVVAYMRTCWHKPVTSASAKSPKVLNCKSVAVNFGHQTRRWHNQEMTHTMFHRQYGM